MNRVDVHSNFTTCTEDNEKTFVSPIGIEPEYIDSITLTINGKTETIFDGYLNDTILKKVDFKNGEYMYKIIK